MTSMSHTTTTAAATPRLRIWQWLIATLIGFPVGGEIANVIVGPVDSFGAALTSGLIAGAVIGAAQWLALRQLVSRLWIAATSLGMAVGLVAGAAIVDYGTRRSNLLVMGAVTGAAVGAAQAFVFARQHIPGAGWWVATNVAAWALAWLITSYVITTNVDEHFTNFGASGTLLFALLTSVPLATVLGRTKSGAREA
jgi:hypothetical protein